MRREFPKPPGSIIFLLFLLVFGFALGSHAWGARKPPEPIVIADTEEDYWPKINRISPPPQVPSDRQLLIESRLKSLAGGGGDPMTVFRRFGEDGISVKDLYGFKADYIREKADEIAKSGGFSAAEAMPQAFDAWQRDYGRAERTLMDARRKGVQAAWDRAVKRYIETHPDFPYIIKMDVGSWPTESWNDLRFEGDIDITAITSMVENAVELRNYYNEEIRSDFRMNMAELDAHATAHRRASLDVYITQPGADWAEMDALNRGKLQEVVIKNGEVTYRPVTDPMERLFIFANLKNNVEMKRGAPDQLARLMDEDVPKPSHEMEPAVSLEFLRHLTVDAIRSNLAPHERLVKIAKFVNRSSVDHRAMLEGFSTTPGDPGLASWAKRVTDIKQDKNRTAGAKLKAILESSRDMLGDAGSAGALERSLNALAERSAALIRHNIGEGIDARIKVIDDARTPSEKDVERKKLLDVLEETYDAYRRQGVDYPPRAYETMVDLARHFKKRAIHIPIAEQRRLAELLEKAADNPNMSEMMLALIWEKTGQYYDAVNDQIDAFNDIMDVLDKATVDKIRALDLELSWTSADGATRLSLPIPIGQINERLNSSVLGVVGNSMPFKAFNLYQEGKAYVDAVMKAKDWSESFSNLSTELFRKHVPGGDLVEAVVMENYARAAIGVVYLLFPVTAVPEGIYGMSVAAAEWGVGEWEQWRYEEMVNALYEGTTFEKSGDSWKVKSISYDCPGKGTVTVTRDEAFSLPELCPDISNILVPQVKNDPSIVLYHELLVNPAISDGQSGIPVWPRKYLNLSRYGEKLWQEYSDAVWRTTRRFFAGVIEELEKRKTFAEGEGLRRIKEIEKELSCTGPLVELTGDPATDRNVIEDVISDYEQLKQVNAGITRIREEWNVVSLRPHRAACHPVSIKKTLGEARKDLENVRQAVKDAGAAVEEILGKSGATHAKKQPAVEARIGAVRAPSGSEERKRHMKTYKDYLDSLRTNVVPMDVRILGPDRVCQGEKNTFSAQLDREARWVKYDWRFEPEAPSETLKNRKGARMEWVPAEPGTYTLVLFAQLQEPQSDWVWHKKKVTVIAAEKCPRPVLELRAPVREVSPGEILPVTAVTTAFGLNGESFERYFWEVNGVRAGASAENTFEFDARGYEGRAVEISVQGRSATGYVAGASMTVTVADDLAGDNLRVLIDPEGTEFDATKPAAFRAVVLGRTAGKDYRYQWSLDGDVLGNDDRIILDPSAYEGEKVTLGLYVQQVEEDRVLYEGQVTRKVSFVTETPVTVRLASWPDRVADSENLRLEVAAPDRDITYQWHEWRGRFWSTNPIATGPKMAASMRGLSGQTVRYKVVATDGKNTASAETGPIEVTEPQWPSEEEEEDEPDAADEPAEETGTAAGEKDEKAAQDAAGEETEDAETWGKIEISAPARVMEGDIVHVKAVIPPDIAEKAAPSYRWGGDASRGIRPMVILGPDVNRDRTHVPEAEIQFLPRPDLRGNPANIGVFVYEKLKANQKGTPTASLASGFIGIKVLPMGCSVTAPSAWEGGPTEMGIVMKRKTAEGEPLTVKGEFILDIVPWPNGTLEAAEEQVRQNNTHRDVAAVAVDDYKGFMATSLTVSDLRVSVGAYEARAVVDGLAVKGQVGLDFGGFIHYSGSVAEYNEEELGEYVENGLAELKAILASIRIVPDPKRTAGAYDPGSPEEKKDSGVVLKRLSPASGPVPAGSPVAFEASLEGDKPEGSVLFQFQPHPEVAFAPYETKKGSTSAVFAEPGTVDVWVVAIDGKGDTIGESESITIEVTGPELFFTVTPDTPKVGQEVTVKAETDTTLPEGAFIAWNLDGTSGRQGAKAADSTEFSFLAEEAGSYTIQAEARSPKGEPLAEGTATIDVAGYDLKVAVLGTAGPRPREWVEGEGLKDVPEGSFMTDEQVRVKAEITDPAAPKDLRWKWIPGEGTSMSSTGIGDEATLSRHEPGTATATVEARNREDLVLARGSASFPVLALPAELQDRPLEVSLKADNTVTVNGTAKLTAEATGGKPPYTFTWSKNVTAGGPEASFVAATPGEVKVSVTVRDSAKKKASATHNVTAGPFTVTLLDVPEEVLLGESFSPRVEYPLSPPASGVNRKPPPRFRWLTEPKTQMTRTLGEEVMNRITATSPGDLSLWVEARNRHGDVLGTSQKHTVRVEAPEFSLKTPESIAENEEGVVEVLFPEGIDGSVLRYEWKNSGSVTFPKGRESRSVTIRPRKGTDSIKIAVRVTHRDSGTTLAELERTIPVIPSEETDTTAEAEKIWTEAAELQQAEKYEEALDKYEEGLKIKEDKAVRDHVEKLEEFIEKKKAEEDREDRAEAIWTEAAELQQSGKYEKALDKYKEGLSIQDDAGVREHVKKLEKYIEDLRKKETEKQKQASEKARAEKIWAEAAELQKAEKYREALGKYYEGLRIHDSQAIRDHIKKLEQFIREYEARQAEAEAEQIWTEAAELQNAKKYEQALEKYKEGLKLHENAAVRDHVKKLEQYIGSLKKTKKAPAKQEEETQPAQAEATQEKPAPAEEAPAPQGSPKGKVTASSRYEPNCKGDPFAGGHWTGARNGSDWIQKDFDSLQLIHSFYIGMASTDITTDGFVLTVKFKNEADEWVPVVVYKGANINREKLSYGKTGLSRPPQTYNLKHPQKAKAFRLEFEGNGWFDAADIRINSTPASAEKKKAPASLDGAAHVSGWRQVTLGPVSFQIPPDWKTDEGNDEDGQFFAAWKGDMNNPEIGVSVGLGDPDDVFGDFQKMKSKGKVGSIKVGNKTCEQVTAELYGVTAMAINCGTVSGGQGLAIMVPFRTWEASKETIEKMLATFRF
jgi:tetratricopeptide (TPR) repeat protein